jgi:dTDP-4-dehydrorhamnose reductase
MMDALLEQIRQIDASNRPHFTYASSYEVYPLSTTPTEPLEETMTLSTPQSLRGASKLMDEFLAKLYHDEHGVFSVGLRFFSVYGPWNAPGSPWFEMAERAVQGQLTTESADASIMDFVYVDDAVDAILLAMQTRRTEPFVVNVASGQGTSWKELTEKMLDYFPNTQPEDGHGDEKGSTTTAYNVASLQRAREVLGYQPRISLDEGLQKVLAWHWDRAYPNGGDHADPSSQPIVSQGIVSCLPTDAECLHAAPVFPCASECSHVEQCTKSYWDVILGWTQALTQHCQNVLYTVALDPSLDSIPSAHIKVQPNSDPFLPEGTCNLAFVSTSSPLVQSLRGGMPALGGMSMDRTQLLRTGSWILIPVESGDSRSEAPLLALLPKLSPGLFFSTRVERAVYVDPDVLVDSLPKMLREASMQPQHSTHTGATALLIGKRIPLTRDLGDGFIPRQQIWESTQSRIQKSAYRMIRIALSELGMTGVLDTQWMVHRLNKDDARLFRCDVAGEVLQWNVQEDRAAWEFVLGLHDLWSRVVLNDDDAPWWTEETAVTVPEGYGQAKPRRRLRELEEEDVGEKRQDEEEDEDEAASAEDDGVETVTGAGDSGDTADGPPGFGISGEAVEDIALGVKRSDSVERDDDQAGIAKLDNGGDGKRKVERDPSSYDIWMGVLSASSLKYFVRIVPSIEVGVVSLTDFETDAEKSRMK